MTDELKSVLIRVLAAAIGVGLVLLLERLINLKKEFRGRQLPLSLLSIVAGAAGVIAVWVRFDRLDLPPESFLAGAETGLWNLVIPLSFLPVKLVGLPIVKAVWSSNARMERWCGGWYVYDEELDAWVLRPRCENLRELLRWLSWLLAALSVAVIALDWCVPAEGRWQLRAFPCAALLVVTEAYYFLSGYTRPEFLRSIGGEDVRSDRLGAYYKLRRVYEAMFPSALLVSHTGSDYAAKEGATQTLRELRESRDPVEQNVGDYFAQLKKRDGLFDVDMISVTNTLLHGSSAIIFNPFYRDLGEYILLPMVHTLIHTRKCLIIVSRGAMCQDVALWARELLKGYSRTRSLWRVEELTGAAPDCEVGILPFSSIYDAAVINANSAFVGDTGFVLLIEPSRMMTTSQVGLGILVEQMDKEAKPTFCVCDHDADGLVDTLSHILQTSLTNVAAAPVPRCAYTAMGWAASGDFMRQKLFHKQTHYLGGGVELAAVALKNQIPHVTWYSAEKAPVRDVRWIAGQYYPQICRYAHLPNQQQCLDERIDFSPNLWGSAVQKEEFVIAEDEFCNLFASMRAYLTRGEEQSFVNIISENYLLRDYMRYNQQLFLSDPKAIPAISPNYAKTERNTVLRLVLMMACGPVAETYVAHELSLLGRETDDIYRVLSGLIGRYTFAGEAVVTVQDRRTWEDEPDAERVCRYAIAREVFDEKFAGTLKNAFFVVEDERFESEYIDARLFGHITQVVMPGQFLTYSGKLYLVHAVSPQIGCVLHRASDAYTGRRYYRQLRTYHLEAGGEVVSSRKIGDIEVVMERRCFSVDTSGYLEMRDNHDLRTARHIDLTDDPNIGVFHRGYKNKSVLRLALPDTDESVRFTLCLLLAELFRTVFPDAWPYLAVVAKRPEGLAGMLDLFTYHVDGDVDGGMIYIIEDSDMDLGLLEAVEGNLMRFLEILADYLSWHFEKIRESPYKDPAAPDMDAPAGEEQRRRGFLSRIGRGILRLLGLEKEPEEKPVQVPKKPAPKKKPEAPAPAEDASPFHDEEDKPEDGLGVEAAQGETAELGEDFELAGGASPAKKPEEPAETPQEPPAFDASAPAEEQIVLHTEGEDLFATDGVPDDLDLRMPIEPSRYQKECFLKFGFDEIDSRLVIEDVRSYLTARGWSNNALTRARRRTELEDTPLDLYAGLFCDFCGMPLSGVSYSRLADGQLRCNDCSATAINDLSVFRSVFQNTEMMMESTFNISVPASITVRMADARTIARHAGQVFPPTGQALGHVAGFAQRKGGKYTLFIESGCPRLSAIDTITHEVTHIWQYLNWNDAQIYSIYRQLTTNWTRTARLILYEGMAVWAAIQLLYALGETSYAQVQEQLTAQRTDVYGVGLRLYRDRFPFQRGGEDPAVTPFGVFPPIDPAEMRRIFEEGQ